MTSSIIVELRPRLQVCNIFVITKENLAANQRVKIRIKLSSIDIEWESKDNVTLQHISLLGNKLVPNSLSALQVQGNSFSFRLQTEPISNVAGSFSTEILPFKEPTNDVTSFLPSIVANKPCKLSCKCCGNMLSSSQVLFHRVLPLPSATWESGDWFCHRHSNSSEPESTPVEAKESDCLFGTCFILVPLSLLGAGDGTTIRCSRCLAWLGTKFRSKAKIWNCTVSCGMEEVERSGAALEDFVFVVKEAIQGSIGMLCRLIIETHLSEEETHYLLLWVMDKDLKLLVNIEQQTTICQQMSDVKPEVDCRLRSSQCIKVLYFHETECTPLVKSWQGDVNVQSIDVAKQMFTQGLQYLVNVTQYLPPSNQVANNFFVSYLGII